MTVLSKKDINRRIGYGGLGVDLDGGYPSIEPSSIDVRLSDTVLVEQEQDEPIDVTDEETYPEYDEETISDGYVIEAGDFVLATTEEVVTITKDLVGYLHGRSSVGRLGMFIENAGLIDPGFNGQITLELYNASRNDIQLQEGMRIGQLTLHKIGTQPDVGYSAQNGNKYMRQEGPTPSRLYEDFL
jgi:dCTP deaminase